MIVSTSKAGPAKLAQTPSSKKRGMFSEREATPVASRSKSTGYDFVLVRTQMKERELQQAENAANDAKMMSLSIGCNLANHRLAHAETQRKQKSKAHK